MTSNSLQGQVVLVTGAGRNLGRALAVEAARRDASVGVMVRSDRDAARQTVRLIEDEDGHAIEIVGDVADATATAAAVARCTEALGPISTVIHAAASRSHQPLLDLTFEEWRRTLDVTLLGAYLLARSTITSMEAAGFGRFVFIGGSSAVTGLPIGCAHVATAKSALRGLARAIAQESGRRGVTANVVSPGMIATESRLAANGDTSFSGWDPVESSALGRMVSVDEVVAAVLFLCEPSAQAITGAQLNVDGGTFAFGD